ncbi:MAG: DUF6498-containing protein [Cytophaga sp.]|uniref:DUF6498-containing protein n=1 Tax=Cytophaga sp. TaxID=29535 RepID=UPI003F804AF6
MNKAKSIYWADITALVFFTILTCVAIATKQITIFYVIYVFWWDEIIKTLSDLFRYVFRKKEIKDRLTYKEKIRMRFFMLSLYVVFIVVCFGFVIEWGNTDAIAKNAQVLLFRNIYFNISLLSFIGREMYVYSYRGIQENELVRTMMSNGIITLHVSIILGILLWAVATRRLGSLPVSLEAYSTMLAIVPFLIIKFLFDWSAIRSRSKASSARNSIDKQFQ